jgi:hypothetical protein
MKTTFLLIGGVIAFALGNIAHSQVPGAPHSSLQKLQAIKAANQQLIERQSETLKKLEEMQLLSQQLKFLGKRA